MNELVLASKSGVTEAWNYDQSKYFLKGMFNGGIQLAADEFPSNIDMGTFARANAQLGNRSQVDRSHREHGRLVFFTPYTDEFIFSKTHIGSVDQAFAGIDHHTMGLSEATLDEFDNIESESQIALHSHGGPPDLFSLSDIFMLRLPVGPFAIGLAAGNYQYFIFNTCNSRPVISKEEYEQTTNLDDAEWNRWWNKIYRQYIENRLTPEDIALLNRSDNERLFYLTVGAHYGENIRRINDLYDRFVRQEGRDAKLVIYVGKIGDRVLQKHPLEQPLPWG